MNHFLLFRTLVLNDAKMIEEAFNLTEMSGRPDIQAFVEGAERKGRADLELNVIIIISNSKHMNIDLCE